MALVVVLGLVLVPVALRSGKPGSPGAAGSAGTSAPPSPSPTPVTPEAYQQILDGIETTLKTQFQQVSEATTPDRLSLPLTGLSIALDYQVRTLKGIAPPPAAVKVTSDLISGLGGLASTVSLLGSDNSVCAGSAALARISQSTAAEGLRSTFKDLATADPAKAYHLGAFLPAKAEDSHRRLNNGNMVRKIAKGGSGQFKVKNSGPTDAVVTLAPTGTKTATFSMYVRTGETASVSGVKDGTYDAYVSSGDDWDSGAKVFTMNCHQQKFDDTFKFSTTGRTYTVWTIELHVATGGNGSSSSVDPGDLPT